MKQLKNKHLLCLTSIVLHFFISCSIGNKKMRSEWGSRNDLSKIELNINGWNSKIVDDSIITITLRNTSTKTVYIDTTTIEYYINFINLQPIYQINPRAVASRLYTVRDFSKYNNKSFKKIITTNCKSLISESPEILALKENEIYYRSINMYKYFNIKSFEKHSSYQIQLLIDLPNAVKNYFPCGLYGSLFSDTLNIQTN